MICMAMTLCLSETLLSPSVSSTLDSLDNDGYNIVRSDHPSGSKRGGVCCYFKESLPIRILKITPMAECLVLGMLYINKLVIVSIIYRSPSQSSQEFAQFEMLFSQLLNDITSKKPFQLSLVISMQGLSVGGALTNKIKKVTAYF